MPNHVSFAHDCGYFIPSGNFSVGDIIPKASTSTLDHWRLALGFDVVKLNKVSGATVNVINTDDGKVRFYVTSDEDPSFHNFVTEPFALADVQNLRMIIL